MQSGTENARRNPRRGPPPVNSITIGRSVNGQDAEDSINSTTPVKSEKARKSRRRASSKVQSNPTQTTSEDAFMTPKKVSKEENIELTEVNGTPATSVKKTSGSKKTDKSRPNAQASSSSPVPKKSYSPRPGTQSGYATPARAIPIPAQAYAGPTFHASPAPSALPIPRFFSRSGTPQDKGSLSETNGQTTSQVESSEAESTGSEDSPTLRNSLHVQNQLTREVSPLDIFFHADREEKAKRQLSISLPPDTDVDCSVSQPADPPRAMKSFAMRMGQPSTHSKNNLLSSTSLSEMDASEKPKSIDGKSVSKLTHPGAHRSYTSPSVMMTPEDCKAKSIALKKLLMSPAKPEIPHTLPSDSSMVQSLPDLYPSTSPQTRSQSSRDSPNRTTPTHYNLRGRRMIDSSPNQLQSRADQNQWASQPRPISSQLRQEMRNGNSSETVELPSTPTPIRSYHDSNPYNNRNVQLNGNMSFPNVDPESSSRTDLDQRKPSVDIGVMEDALRKILKLDALGSTTATGVHS
ncbi:MAG: hypothetical protein MMC33_001135 [Icmadophila ericetorum]|nr:hypothetical protein [Icmadophila ericetorum]